MENIIVFTFCHQHARKSTCYGQFPAMRLEKMQARMFARQIVGNWLNPHELCNVPPTSHASKRHCQRAHFQTALWIMAGNSASPHSNQFGWVMTGNVSEVTRISQGQDIAPPAVVILIRLIHEFSITGSIALIAV